uniref:IG domain-containing protein n=1 Tax=Angiostrongylus cantonensis TaxID=6313 RepID=A0A0K0CY25_ANGCA
MGVLLFVLLSLQISYFGVATDNFVDFMENVIDVTKVTSEEDGQFVWSSDQKEEQDISFDDYVEYSVGINQRADVYVQYNLTKNGFYKFSVEAHDGKTVQTAKIHVEVLSLSPSTHRGSTSAGTTTPSTVVFQEITPTDVFKRKLELIFEGAQNNTLEIEKLLSKGDVLHGLALSVLSNSEGKRSPANLSLDRSDLFDIRPKLLYPGSKAYLFANGHSLDASTIPIKRIELVQYFIFAAQITAVALGSTSTRELTLTSVSRGQNFTENVEREDMSSVIEYDLFIPENAESGSTIGQIEDGESKRVVGPPGL